MGPKILERRRFLSYLGSAATVSPLLPVIPTALGSTPPDTNKNLPWPKRSGSPVLDSLHYAIESSRDVQSHYEKIVEVASWMAYEELPMPEFALPFGVGAGDRNEAIDFIMVADSIDSAFTDFGNHEKFQVDFGGEHWSDSDAMFACLKRALDNGIPVLDGKFLATLTRKQLDEIFKGNIEMPMLDEKLKVLQDVGKVLAAKYDGHFHNFINSCPPKVYDQGKGIVDRMVVEFPRFNDVSDLDGHEIKFYKLAQLGVWMMYATMHKSGKFKLEDADKMTAFADYIVPVALRVLGIVSYSKELEHAINAYQMIPRDSRWEIEIRAHTIYATAMLTEEINKLRPADMQIIIPQIDARFWTHYHTTHWPHHLTKTIMY
jgi:putative queuosine salvage protein